MNEPVPHGSSSKSTMEPPFTTSKNRDATEASRGIPAKPTGGAVAHGEGGQSPASTSDRDLATANQPAPLKTSTALGWLTVGAVVGGIFLLAWAYSRYQLSGVMAAGLAIAVCYLSAAAALWIVSISRSHPQLLAPTLFSMALRTGIPLTFGLFVQQAGGPLVEAGIFGMILCYYLWLLLVETVLAAAIHQPWNVWSAAAVRPPQDTQPNTSTK